MTHRVIQLYRGTKAQNDAYTGSVGELTMDTTNNKLRLHDGSTAGGHEIGGGSYHPDLFDWKWADHQLDDVQWLRADTFSWQSGAVYQAAYAHLADDITGKTLQSETISGTTIQFYLADDGHKVCPASEESNVASIFSATGVAWYYIIDTTNQRFKLPRTKHNKYAGTLGVVGNGMTLGLTDGTNNAGLTSFNIQYGQYDGVNKNAFGTNVGTTGMGSSAQLAENTTQGITTDPTKSGIVAQQPQDTDQYKYLYFYVGAFTQTAIENTAGLNTELFNGKADLNLANVLSNIDFVIESQLPTAANNYTWYRKYKSGWVEQGGIKEAGTTTINFPVAMANTDYWYIVKGNYNNQTGSYASSHDYVTTKNTTDFVLSTGGTTACWEVRGRAAS